MVEHAPSYYAATANRKDARPPLAGTQTADVCIVGAGFTGISAALELLERGFSVVVLEAARVGWGASGRNGGQIVNGYSRDLDVISDRYGAAAGRAIGAIDRHGSTAVAMPMAAATSAAALAKTPRCFAKGLECA